jgi:hypothetical protein
MTFSDEPNWKIEWRGHPDGHTRQVRVFFADGAMPGNAENAGLDLGGRLNEAKTEGEFNWQVTEFAEQNGLRVTGVTHEPSHRFPLGTVVTVGFEKEAPPTISVVGMEPPTGT